MNDILSIDICICTFRRDHIKKTLTSLASLQTDSSWAIRVIVADNDDTPSAKINVEAASETLPFQVIYLHAPARNICIARNACLDAATARFIVFLDDDEVVGSQWLKSLIETQECEKADAVLGPVDAIYDDAAPAWMKKGDFHSTRPVWVNGSIITGYTCNLLLYAQSSRVKGLRFLPELGKTGGEDTVFLSTVYGQGGKIAYAEKAILTEPVPESRASLFWLIKRRFRSGQTHGLLLIKNHGDTAQNKILQIAKATIKACTCFMIAIPFIIRPPQMVKWVLRGSLHIGVIARLIGQKELVQYGQ